jgi:hypothetical protein
MLLASYTFSHDVGLIASSEDIKLAARLKTTIILMAAGELSM